VCGAAEDRSGATAGGDDRLEIAAIPEDFCCVRDLAGAQVAAFARQGFDDVRRRKVFGLTTNGPLDRFDLCRV
jgi:hypothetical protein